MDEKWRKSNKFKNYEISNNGKIRNKKTGKILRPTTDKNGNEIVFLYDDGKKCKRNVHRLVAETYLPGDINDLRVKHIDGNKQNNSVDNLKLVNKKKKIKVLETGGVYDSITECSKAIGISEATVSKCANYKFYNNRQGYHFESLD